MLKSIIDFLTREMQIPIAGELYEDAPERIVTVNITGKDRENMLDTAQIIATSYGESMADAYTVNEAVEKVLFRLPELDEISAAYRVTSYQAAETATRRYRYKTVFNITHY